ncbi:methyltransferase domain-containing protein [Actinomadura roseirufa]|uniref:methyltransferase domain-containing protein n=1 Tax=Actinomadura roseirufa TaxID=2094049 RepID=UPI0013F14824|nr:methyltransferase domain-containing protein [Actinomadura roseirufa]
MTEPDLQDEADWKRLLEEVPRHLFIPDIAVVGPIMDDPASWIDREQDPARWWKVVHSDTAIGTQLDDGTINLTGKTSVDPGAMPTSSCSAPLLVAAMLDLLDAHPEDRVLEIGTGTGWTAALLAERVGQDNVVTVEIDAAVAARAAANLKAAGYAPHVIVGDGTLGWRQGAPYDRVHVTVGVADIPYTWVEQTQPGGVLVLPWMPGWKSGYLLRLTVDDDGTASGPIGESCGFMLLRGQRPPLRPIDDDDRVSRATVAPREMADAGEGFAVAVAGLLPGVRGTGVDNADGSFRMALRHGDSHALATHRPAEQDAEVSQSGPRNLWDELVAAYLRWNDWGRPPRDQFGITVTSKGAHMWLGHPDTPVEDL